MVDVVGRSAEREPAQDPRTVSRGLKLQSGFIGIDSLYVVVEYPHKDVFDYWSQAVDDIHDVRLNEGIPYNDMVIRRGLIGYKLSVWFDDARLLITDRVESALIGTPSEGQGMGVMLQLGPKWLRRYGDESHQYLILNLLGQLILFGMKEPQKYPIRLNRVDIAVDVLGLKVADFSTDEWREQWVGYASKMNFHTASRSRDLQGLSVGSSEGAVRFKVYDKLTESEQRGTSRFWRSVWGVSESELVDVARFEWSIKAYKAKFSHIQYLSDFSQERLYRLLNYASLKWGRLCIPQPEDSNQSRWPLTPLWAGIQELINDWNDNYDGLARRDYDYRADISPAYLNSYAGWTAGLMTRIGLEEKGQKPVTFGDAFLYLNDKGLTLPELEKRAGKKWKVASKLAGVQQ